MEFSISEPDDKTRSVTVTFEHEGVTHIRPVNACYTKDGDYDEEATTARVEQVALGVENKIALGVIVAREAE